tara:strand:+ start:1123 stop:2124 length:1002 start_codon:yes stop_codon:yes gene_type:complete
MSNYIDLKFINLLSTRLDKFKQKTDYLFNFRCPHCGDSTKNKSKARGYMYRVKNDMFFKCHNCGMGQSLGNFIKFLDSKLYSEYLLERYKGSAPATPKPLKQFDFKPKFEQTNILEGLKKISELDLKHPARQYVEKRLIPPQYYDILYYCNKFHTYANKIKPDTFPLQYDHPRLVIPFYDVSGNLFAFQGRAFGKEQPKYITIKLDENKQKIYGLERINYQQEIFVVEGPIDSLFIDNSIAAAGADLKSLRTDINNVTYIFDNEPRNKEIVKRMYEAVERDYKIVIWPDTITQKDINEIIQSGVSKDELQTIISTNTFSKLEALTRLNAYKRI